jgi:LmbE family N-acetylglucosaminyl deacetylase
MFKQRLALIGRLLPVALLCGLSTPLSVMAQTPAQQTPLRVIAFGAHPDDCDGKFGGTAAKFAKSGAAVKFVSITNGDAGHQDMGGAALARRRYNETQESARRLGIAEYQVMNNHDGELMPTLEVRREVIRAIRGWKADIVLSPRPNDYHPDHRYTGVLVQDAAYMVVVPNIVSDVPALRKNPIFLYYDDNFQQPNPFRPDVAVSIDDVWSTKIDDLDAQVSQMYEWLPWVAGNLEQVPKDAAARKQWLSQSRGGRISPAIRAALVARYGAAEGGKIQHAEAFQLCEYGSRASIDQLRAMFPK